MSDKKLEELSLILAKGLEEGMQALSIDKELEKENESVSVEEAISLMTGLQLLCAGI